MKNILLFGWLAIATILAIPTVLDYTDEYLNGDTDSPILEGAAVDSQAKFTQDIAELIIYADTLGYKLTFGEVWRTRYQQRHNIAIGVSWTMNSNHLKRKAVDFNLFVNDSYVQECQYYAILGEYWESLDEHNVWGGNFNDSPHFERRESLRQADKYRSRKRCR